MIVRDVPYHMSTDAPTPTEDDFEGIEHGQTVYDEDGNELGSIRGFDEAGFYVRAEEDYRTDEVDRTRDIFGKEYAMWRCWECGEMGRIEGADLPSSCPDCGAPKEELYYWAED
jgi:rubrerythrin